MTTSQGGMYSTQFVHLKVIKKKVSSIILLFHFSTDI